MHFYAILSSLAITKDSQMKTPKTPIPNITLSQPSRPLRKRARRELSNNSTNYIISHSTSVFDDILQTQLTDENIKPNAILNAQPCPTPNHRTTANNAAPAKKHMRSRNNSHIGISLFESDSDTSQSTHSVSSESSLAQSELSFNTI